MTTGDGNADVDIVPVTTLSLGGALTIATGSDLNSISIGNLGTVTGKAVTITTGNGESEIELEELMPVPSASRTAVDLTIWNSLA